MSWGSQIKMIYAYPINKHPNNLNMKHYTSEEKNELSLSYSNRDINLEKGDL